MPSTSLLMHFFFCVFCAFLWLLILRRRRWRRNGSTTRTWRTEWSASRLLSPSFAFHPAKLLFATHQEDCVSQRHREILSCRDDADDLDYQTRVVPAHPEPALHDPELQSHSLRVSAPALFRLFVTLCFLSLLRSCWSVVDLVTLFGRCSCFRSWRRHVSKSAGWSWETNSNLRFRLVTLLSARNLTRRKRPARGQPPRWR